MENNYIKTRKYNYIISGYYASTNNVCLASIYYNIKLLEKKSVDDSIFPLVNSQVQFKHFVEGARINETEETKRITARMKEIYGIFRERINDENAKMDDILEMMQGIVPDIDKLDKAVEKKEWDMMNSFDLNRKILVVTANNYTMDMSIGNLRSETQKFLVKDISPKDSLTVKEMPESGNTEIISISDESITLSWLGKEYNVKLGEEIKTIEVSQENIYLSRDEIYMTYEYKEETLFDRAIELIVKIGNIHEASVSSVHPETIEDEELALAMLDRLIQEGDVEIYVLKALLSASNNWSEGIIVRDSQYKEILLEGIEKGCLNPEFSNSWHWLYLAVERNKPYSIMDDLDKLYEILSDAYEKGNEKALEIKNLIWEPEQTIEED